MIICVIEVIIITIMIIRLSDQQAHANLVPKEASQWQLSQWCNHPVEQPRV